LPCAIAVALSGLSLSQRNSNNQYAFEIKRLFRQHLKTERGFFGLFETPC